MWPPQHPLLFTCDCPSHNSEEKPLAASQAPIHHVSLILPNSPLLCIIYTFIYILNSRKTLNSAVRHAALLLCLNPITLATLHLLYFEERTTRRRSTLGGPLINWISWFPLGREKEAAMAIHNIGEIRTDSGVQVHEWIPTYMKGRPWKGAVSEEFRPWVYMQNTTSLCATAIHIGIHVVTSNHVTRNGSFESTANFYHKTMQLYHICKFNDVSTQWTITPTLILSHSDKCSIIVKVCIYQFYRKCLTTNSAHLSMPTSFKSW